MSTRLKDKEEKILQILERLAEESSSGTPIIVEGKKDIKTLRTLGVKGKIISAKTSGKSLLEVISEIENCGTQEVILMLDFDRRGREWMSRLREPLERAGTKTDTTFWRELSALVGKEVKDIEGIAAYMETLKRKIYNS